RLDHGIHHVGGAVIFPLLQQLPHLAQVGAHRRLQRGIALDQGPRDTKSDTFDAHPGLLDGGFAHGRLLVGIGTRAGAAVRSNRSAGIAEVTDRNGTAYKLRAGHPTPPSPPAWLGRPAASLPSGP